MFRIARLCRRWMIMCVLALAAGIPSLFAQDETLEDIKYKEDYDRLQIVSRTSPGIKRLERLIAFYAEKSDMDSKLKDYADNLFTRDMEGLLKQSNYAAIKGLCERTLKVRPKFGEANFFYGICLKNEKKMDEAMKAFAKAYVIKNPLQPKAKQQLDLAYRGTHKGSLIGQDKFIKEATKGLQ